jgi:hypothetical protein
MEPCYLQLTGGLGNQLFEIAAGYAHAKRTGRTLQISATALGGRPAYWRTFLHKCAHWVATMPLTGLPLWKEPHFHYSPIPPQITAFRGFFQSSRDFNDVSGEIRALFDPHPIIKSVVATKYADLLRDAATDGCVVHIRRTDYLTGANAPIHAVCDKAWYARALAEMDRVRSGRPTHYLVFSDDLDWCRSQADLWTGRHVTFVDERNDCVTLHLMSHFRNFVISNSSFSWWATWLQPTAKTVVAPARWFGKGGPQDWEDVYEPEWIRLA